MLRATFLVLASWGAAPRFAQNGSPKPAPTARPDERCGEVWQTWWRGRASNGAARDPWATAPSDAGEWRAAPESLGFWELAGKGLETLVDRTFPLDDVTDAHRYVEAEKNFGRVLLKI